MNSPASDFPLILQQASALLEGESNYIANAANLSALIFNSVERLNWAGFYFLTQAEAGAEELVLGPFSGQVACTRIAIGKGVCGTSYQLQETQVVEDVHEFEGHIACDAASESEIVVPFQHSIVSGVLDIDSPFKARFGEKEKEFFEAIVSLYLKSLG